MDGQQKSSHGTLDESEKCSKSNTDAKTSEDSSQCKKREKFEASRRKFFQLLQENKMVWAPTNQEHDMDVEISRLYLHDPDEHVAFMKINPRGFRAPRLVPNDLEIRFHLLIGQIKFLYNGETKIMTAGQWHIVLPGSTYGLRSVNDGQTAYLIFKIQDREKIRLDKSQEEQQQQQPSTSSK